jgi:hypothetical protein
MTTTMEPPYIVPHPAELTHQLCTNWLCIRAQNRQCSHSLESAQVKQHVPSTHNSNLHLKFTDEPPLILIQASIRGECSSTGTFDI